VRSCVHMGIDSIPSVNVKTPAPVPQRLFILGMASKRACTVVLALGSEKSPTRKSALVAYAYCMDVGHFDEHIKMFER